MEENGEKSTFLMTGEKKKEHAHCLPKDSVCNGKSDGDEKPCFAAQFQCFLSQAFKVYRPRYFSITRIVYSACFVLIYALAWCQMSLTEPYIVSRKLALYLLNVHTGFDCICETAGCRSFTLETKKRGEKEESHPLPVRLAYMLARMTSETVLLLGHLAPQFIAIYWIVGYAPSLQAFVTTVFILLANGVTAQSLGRLIGSMSPVSIGDTVCVANGTMIFISVFAGFVMFSQPKLQYLNYISYQFYSLAGVFQSEFILGETAMSCSAANATMFGSCQQAHADHIPANDVIGAFDAIGSLIPSASLCTNVIVMLVFPLFVNACTLAAFCFVTRPRGSKAHTSV